MGRSHLLCLFRIIFFLWAWSIHFLYLQPLSLRSVSGLTRCLDWMEHGQLFFKHFFFALLQPKLQAESFPDFVLALSPPSPSLESTPSWQILAVPAAPSWLQHSQGPPLAVSPVLPHSCGNCAASAIQKDHVPMHQDATAGSEGQKQMQCIN